MKAPSFVSVSRDQRNHEEIKREILAGVDRIRVKLHRIKFSGNYEYKTIEKKLGKIKIENNFESKKRMPNYEKCGYIQLPDEHLTIFFNPKKEGMPKFYFETTDSKQEFLNRIRKSLLFSDLSSVEYSVDFFCKNHEKVADLFYLFRRYLYCPYSKKTKIKGGKYAGWREPREKNRVYTLTNKLKVYERGIDSKRIGQFWLHKDVKWLRVELTLRRDDLKKYDLYSLSDLIKNPKFEDILYPRFQFKKFNNKSSQLPREWEEYNAHDETGNLESLQEEILKAKKNKLSNVRQYLEDSEGFETLKTKIKRKLLEIDNKWKKKAKEYIPCEKRRKNGWMDVSDAETRKMQTELNKFKKPYFDNRVN